MIRDTKSLKNSVLSLNKTETSHPA